MLEWIVFSLLLVVVASGLVVVVTEAVDQTVGAPGGHWRAAHNLAGFVLFSAFILLAGIGAVAIWGRL